MNISKIILLSDRSPDTDEFMAACIALAASETGCQLERRAAFADDFSDPETLVFGQAFYDKRLLNLTPRGLPPRNRKGLFHLVLDEVLGEQRAESFMEVTRWAKWVGYRSILGERQAFTELKISYYADTESPIGLAMCGWLGNHDGVVGTILTEAMIAIGQTTLDDFYELEDALDAVRSGVELQDLDGIKVAFIPDLTHQDVVGAWRRLYGQDIAITVTHGDLGHGQVATAYRYNDDSRIDLYKLHGKPGIQYADSRGFIATFTHRIEDAESLREAIL